MLHAYQVPKGSPETQYGHDSDLLDVYKMALNDGRQRSTWELEKLAVQSGFKHLRTYKTCGPFVIMDFHTVFHEGQPCSSCSLSCTEMPCRHPFSHTHFCTQLLYHKHRAQANALGNTALSVTMCVVAVHAEASMMPPPKRITGRAPSRANRSPMSESEDSADETIQFKKPHAVSDQAGTRSAPAPDEGTSASHAEIEGLAIKSDPNDKLIRNVN